MASLEFSKLTGLIDDTDPSILSNITTLRIQKTIVPVLNTVSKYNLGLSLMFFTIHIVDTTLQWAVSQLLLVSLSAERQQNISLMMMVMET